MILASFVRAVREMGLANALLFAASRAIARLTSQHVRLFKYYVTAQPVPAADQTPARRGRNIVVVEAQRDEVLQLPVDRPRDVLAARFEHGGRCLVARKDGDFAGFQWFSLTSYREDEVRCLFELDPADRCAWDFDVFVVPELRTQPVFARLWDECNRCLRAAGVDCTLSRINAFNGASRRAHERLGARIIGWAVFLCLGRTQLALFPARPWLHLSLRPGQVPALAVSQLARKHTRPIEAHA